MKVTLAFSTLALLADRRHWNQSVTGWLEWFTGDYQSITPTPTWIKTTVDQTTFIRLARYLFITGYTLYLIRIYI